MFTQNNEEIFILNWFKDYQTGRFMDIGAYHITRFSNVRALYEKGFKGVLVEPAPKNFQPIADHYKDDPEMKVLNFAVGNPAGEITFYESDGDAVSTSDIPHMEKWGAAGVKYTPIKVQQVGVEDFFNQYCHDIDFLSIDTESTNMELFRSIPDFVFDQISLFCIEHDSGIEEIEERLAKFGFETLYTNAENIILGKA